MNLDLDVQYAVPAEGLPSAGEIRLWVLAALAERRQDVDMTVRITDTEEITALNSTYRQQNKATNVLSFPMDIPEELGLSALGDVVICAEVVAREAQEQSKSNQAHWAHMVVHGTLHLLGYDHIEEDEAEEMEALECQLLQQLGFADPYGE